MDTFLSTDIGLPAPQAPRHGNRDILPSRVQRDAAAAEPPWTATRCLRQLRPLQTHLAALRREKAKDALKQKYDTTRALCNTNKRPHSDDGMVCRKRVRRTYSRKGTWRQRREQPTTTRATTHVVDSLKAKPLKQHAPRTFCPGEVVMATPILSRARKQRQAHSLPSSPIMSFTSAARSLAGHDVPLAAEADARSSKDFKYRGYFHRPSHLGSTSSAKSPIDEQWEDLAKMTSPEVRHLYESIFRATDALLRSTARSPSSGPAKSNSLLAMCLRKVPQFVTVCEDEERAEAEMQGMVQPASSNILHEVYSDLESLGGGNSGWPHLCVAARQHGINMLVSACAEGLLDDIFARLLIGLCAHMKAYREAECLIDAQFDSHVLRLQKGQSLFRKPEDVGSVLSKATGPPAALHLLLQYAGDTGRTSYLLRKLQQLLSDGLLPVAWMSTEAFGSLWNLVVRLLSCRGAPTIDDESLLQFSATAIARLIESQRDDYIQDMCQTPGSRVSLDSPPSKSESISYHTLVSILASICTVGILQKEAALDSAGTEPFEPAIFKRLSVMSEHARSVATHNAAASRRRPTHQMTVPIAQRRFLLALAVSFSGVHQTDAENKALIGGLGFAPGPSQAAQLYDVAVTFATSLAECCGRGTGTTVPNSTAARPYLQKICTQAAGFLCRLSDFECEETLAKQLLADAAFLLASRSNDLRDLAYAESLARPSRSASHQRLPLDSRRQSAPASFSIQTAQPLVSTGGSAPGTAIFDGYVWEEGISEWVVATPSQESICRGRSATPSWTCDRGLDSSCLRDVSHKMPCARPGRRAVAAQLPTLAPSPECDDVSSDTTGSGRSVAGETWKTPSARDAHDARDTPPSSPGPARPPQRSWRLNRASWRGKPGLRAAQSLLSLVSDDDDDSGDDYDRISDVFHQRGLATAGAQRAPKRGRLSVGADRITRQELDDSTSDDELCL